MYIRNDLDVNAYLKNLLDELLSGNTDYASLRPDAWAKSHPDSIRDYRQKERRERYSRREVRSRDSVFCLKENQREHTSRVTGESCAR